MVHCQAIISAGSGCAVILTNVHIIFIVYFFSYIEFFNQAFYPTQLDNKCRLTNDYLTIYQVEKELHPFTRDLY